MPAVGLPVMLRMLSAPEPREVRPSSASRISTSGGPVGADLADLQVGARGDVGIAAAQVVGDVGHAAELVRVQDAAGNAQPAHEGVLRRGDIEQAVELGQEDVGSLGETCRSAAKRGDLVEAVERMLLALGLLLRRPACRRPRACGPARRDAGRRVRGRRSTARRQAEDGAARLDAGHEALEVFLLLGA